MVENLFLGTLEGGALKISTFLGPKMASCQFQGSKKSKFSEPTPFQMAHVMDLKPIKGGVLQY